MSAIDDPRLRRARRAFWDAYNADVITDERDRDEAVDRGLQAVLAEALLELGRREAPAQFGHAHALASTPIGTER